MDGNARSVDCENQALGSVPGAGGGAPDTVDRLTEALPRRDRCILRLLGRGVPISELAGALGMTRASLQRRIRRVRKLADDPAVTSVLRAWRHLDPADRRLVYLHRVLRLSLREIARRGLAAGLGQGAGPPGRTLSALRRRMRRIERRARRLGSRRGESGDPLAAGAVSAVGAETHRAKPRALADPGCDNGSSLRFDKPPAVKPRPALLPGGPGWHPLRRKGPRA